MMKEPKSLTEVREWKQKVSDEMNRLGMKKYHRKHRKETDNFIKNVCKKELTSPRHPVERRLSKV
jgi:HKD family nuclease